MDDGHQIKKAMVEAHPECKGQVTCLECTRPKCRYDTDGRRSESPRMKVCPVCGKELKKNRKLYKYCSKECQKQGRRLRQKENKAHINEYQRQRKHEPDFYKRLDQCCKRHGGIDNCPYSDCICS